jgi:hypothetical protein
MIFRSTGFILIVALTFWLAQPVMAFHNPWMWVTLVFWGLAGAVFFGLGNEDRLITGLVGWAIASLFIALVGVATTWSLFHSERYYAQLGAETKGDFNVVLPPIDAHEAPLVSLDMAHRSAEKKLAQIPALGSQVEIGPLHKQLVNGRLYWVGYLEHSSWFRWLNNKTTPGYVRVSAVDSTDVELVTQIDGKPLALRYLPSAGMGDDLMTHLYLHGYAGRGVSRISPEVDEKGYPWFVVTFYKNDVGFSGATTDGIAIVDPQTGVITPYATKDAPAWADILESPSMVSEQVANRGELVHGWFNPSQKDRLAVSGDPDLVYGADGRAYWYVGLTSTGKDAGLVGFYLIDSRTRAAHRFVLAGATEEVAQRAAEGVMPEKHYEATNPLPFVVAGRPTYVFALKDASGIARAYAMVNIQTFQNVAVGNSLAAALRQYEAMLGRDPTNPAGINAKNDGKTLTGRLLRIGSTVTQGNTSFSVMVDGLPGHILVAGVDLSEALPLAREGDSVTVGYEENDRTRVFNLTRFEDAAVLGANQAPEKAPPTSRE